MHITNMLGSLARLLRVSGSRAACRARLHQRILLRARARAPGIQMAAVRLERWRRMEAWVWICHQGHDAACTVFLVYLCRTCFIVAATCTCM